MHFLGVRPSGRAQGNGLGVLGLGFRLSVCLGTYFIHRRPLQILAPNPVCHTSPNFKRWKLENAVENWIIVPLK